MTVALLLFALAMPGRLIDVGGGRQMHIVCVGSGFPTVVFEAGAGEGWYTWTRVQDALARDYRTCSYDRAGFAFSDARPGPRTVAGIVDDLHTLLARAGERPPYVMVGHSMGGEFVRAYAAKHRHEVAGMVLVDSSYEDDGTAPFRPFIEGIRAQRVRQIEAMRRSGEWPSMGAPDALPDDVAKRIEPLTATSKWWEARFAEGRMADYKPSVPVEQRQLDIPLVVISATASHRPSAMPEAEWRELEHAHAVAQNELAMRSPYGRLVLAPSGHYVQLERPDIVIDAVRSVACEIAEIRRMAPNPQE
jgi:pimeloyl-ACP methyl ester carboxylesterase